MFKVYKIMEFFATAFFLLLPFAGTVAQKSGQSRWVNLDRKSQQNNINDKRSNLRSYVGLLILKKVDVQLWHGHYKYRLNWIN